MCKIQHQHQPLKVNSACRALTRTAPRKQAHIPPWPCESPPTYTRPLSERSALALRSARGLSKRAAASVGLGAASPAAAAARRSYGLRSPEGKLLLCLSSACSMGGRGGSEGGRRSGGAKPLRGRGERRAFLKSAWFGHSEAACPLSGESRFGSPEMARRALVSETRAGGEGEGGERWLPLRGTCVRVCVS